MSVFEGSRALVTGGLGLIGSSVARKLVSIGCDVTILDNLRPDTGGNLQNVEDFRHRTNIVIGDICDRTTTDQLVQGQDFLFHLAAQSSHTGSMSDPYDDLTTNVTGTLNLLESARFLAPDIQIVFSSTRQVFGRADYLPVDEGHSVRPPDVNAINKVAAEQYFELYNKIYGLRSTILRLTNIYGPGMRIKDAKQNFLGVWIKQMLEKNPLLIFGDGQQIRDFVFVDDCADLFLKVAAARPENCERFVIGGGHPISLLELASTLTDGARLTSFKCVPFPSERSAIDIGDFYGTYERASKHFGWEPETDLKKGLQITLDYYRRLSAHYL